MERRINDTLRQLQITRVAVAHRPETIKAAGRVFSLGNKLPETNVLRMPMLPSSAAAASHPAEALAPAAPASTPTIEHGHVEYSVRATSREPWRVSLAQAS
jgi:hypothetical protein